MSFTYKMRYSSNQNVKMDSFPSEGHSNYNLASSRRAVTPFRFFLFCFFGDFFILLDLDLRHYKQLQQTLKILQSQKY